MNIVLRFGLLCCGALWASFPLPALAHAADDGFVLLLPTNIYIPAGVGAFAVTALILMFMSARSIKKLSSTLPLSDMGAPDWLVVPVSLLSTAVFFGLLYIGWTGPHDPLVNLLPLMIWSSLWAGFASLHMLVGDLWRWVNPWAGFYRLIVGAGTDPLLKMPAAVGIWPALVFFILFAGFSIVDPAPTDPERLARLAAGYWLITFVGMVVFGQKPWLERCEFFSVFFGLLSHVSWLRLYPKAELGLPGWSALSLLADTRLSVPIFCVVMLGIGSFDGLAETFWWLAKIGVNPLDFEGRSTILWQSIGGIASSIVILLAAFMATAWLGCLLAARFGQARAFPLRQVFAALAFSTIPIFLGFHFAHFLPTFLTWSQYTLLALNDPLAIGTNLLGLEGLRVRVGFLAHMQTVHVIWLVQGAVIVISHIIAVVIAHTALQRAYAQGKQALWAELPAAVFLLGYTWFGLWLLAAARGA